jgi:NADH-quinone oxidoreductase subunit L
MTVPLLVLAVGAAFAGLLNLPFSSSTEILTHWLEPVIGANETVFDLSTAKLIAELTVSTIVAALGISAAYFVYLRHKLDPARIELPLFAHGWYIDSSITAFTGGAGRHLFELVAMFDRVVIDGAVNGVGRATRGGAARLRGLQSGYVRAYALMIAVGAVLVVAFILTQVTF